MAYKDKDKQREADRARQKRRRDKIKSKGVTTEGVTQGVTGQCKEGEELDPREFVPIKDIPNYGQPDCQCMHCQTKRANNSRNVINHGPYKPASQLGEHEINRVALPGDPDYKGVANGKRA